MPPILLLAGATASGKSALALELAQRNGAVIINADSMQIYADAPILTAQPTQAEQESAPHHLYGFRDAAQPFSVALWLKAVSNHIAQCQNSGHSIIIVGGTGLYFKALTEGLHSVPKIPDTVRQKVRAMDNDTAYAALKEQDAVMANRLNPTDTQRISRALEVMNATGKSLDYWQNQPVTPPLSPQEYRCYITTLPRFELYARINARYDMMLHQGGLEEAQRLYARNLPDDLPLCRAVGIAQLLSYYKGECNLDDAIIKAKTSSRNYAKRQLTWMRNQMHYAQTLDMTASLSTLIKML